jgi:hypothetical protein
MKDAEFTQNYYIFPAAFDINISFIIDPKIGLLKCKK